jgi:hypothetical protein
MIRRVLIAAPVIVAFSGTLAPAQEELSGRCTLTYKASVDATGPCTVLVDEPVVTIKGIVEENGQKYIAVIDNIKNEGLLIGAGTFALADGPLATNDTNKITWSNGYVLTIKPSRAD